MNTVTLQKVISSYTGNPYPILEIHEKILYHNLDLIKKIVGSKVKILIPVKANAYGCGIAEMIPFFQKSNPEYLGVANPYEGCLLRKYGWTGKVLNLGGFFPHMADIFFDNDITPSITDVWQVERLDQICRSKNQHLDVHIKLDLGMGRIGVLTDDIEFLVEQIQDSGLIHVTGIFTHYPSADQPEKISNQEIGLQFREISGMIIEALKLDRKDIILHAANSYSIMMNPDSHFDMVRPGLVFYGYFGTNQDRQKFSSEFPFKPSLQLTARPISIRNLRKGSTISYGETFTVDNNDTSVGVIPLGYADGIPRNLSNKINFGGHPLLGRVTMDQIVLGGVSDPGEIIQLLGPDSPPLEQWAELCSMISYEIMTGLGDRIQRKLV